MINKFKNKKNIENCIDISTKYDFDILTNKFIELNEFNDNYKIRILLIGGFSVGKSALLNKYIGMKKLRENQLPETDLATELHYSETEKCIVNLKNGIKKEINDISNINYDEVNNIEYYLNSENIKKYSDYILVDTPGLDSGIEKHNKALMQYIDKATVFFVVVDCEKGTIPNSVLSFLKEISNYSNNIAIIVNKCDKKIDSEVESVKNLIQLIASDYLEKEIPVISTSIKEENVVEKFNNLIDKFDSQKIYEENIYKLLKELCEKLVNSLQVKKNNVECNLDEINKEIEKRENTKKILLEQIEKEKNKRNNDGVNIEKKQEILSEIRKNLEYNIDILARSLEYGKDSFKEKIIEIIRPIMIKKIENYYGEAYTNILNNIDIELKMCSNYDNDFGDVLSNIITNMKNIDINENIFSIFNNKTNSSNLAGIYKTISSLVAIVTNVVSPIIEVVLVFLPDILKIIGNIFGESKEDKLRSAVIDSIPKIMEEISNELSEQLKEIDRVLLNNLEINIQESINMENEVLEKIKIEKENVERDYFNRISEIDKDIEYIENIKNLKGGYNE